MHLPARRQTLIASATIVACTIPTSTSAQITPDTLPPVGLDTITVSVMRVPLPLFMIPFAVTVKTDSMAGRFQSHLALGDALIGVPGVEVQNRYNYAQGDRVSVRGFGARTQFGIRGVRILVDGIPATLADGQTTLDHLDLGTIERVETFRGPASSLYGNSSGGVIRFETLQPYHRGFRQQFGAVTGSSGLTRLESSTRGNIGPTVLALEVAGFSYDGYRQHANADKLFATGHVRYQNGGNDLHATANLVDFDALNPGSLTDSMLAVDRSMANPFNVTQQTGKDAQQLQLGLAWNNRATGGTLHASAYGLLRNLDNRITVRVIDLERKAGGARLQYERDTWIGMRNVRWAVGFETAIQSDDRTNYENQQGERGDVTTSQDQRVWSLGPFLQFGLPIVDQIDLLAGLRYDKVRFTAEDRLCGAQDGGCQSERAMDAWSPSLGLMVHASRRLDLYANLATAFETPTTTELGNTPDGTFGYNEDLDPQRVVSIELGARGRWGTALEYNVAAYRAHVTDALVPFEVPDQPGRTFFQNAGSAVHQGFEAGASLELIQRLTVSTSYSHIDARFEEFGIGGENFDGNRIPGVAPHQFEIAASYDHNDAWYVAANLSAVSETAVNDANTAATAGYVVVDLRAGTHELTVGGLGFAPYLGITNLFDAAFNSSVVVNAFGGRYYEPGPPRSVWLGATVALLAR
ncbi:MAG: TonB-dependent receptor [Gemmatimonadota bacterium]|nr:MAG: TonB-dependent receptor [Gemmatimonadota bacterium]